jgi:RecA/RadA recombinase
LHIRDHALGFIDLVRLEKIFGRRKSDSAVTERSHETFGCFVEPFDPTWAKKFPDHGEQVIDISDGLMDADDCGLVVLDSFAALDKQNDPGDLAMVGKRLFDKVVAAQRKAEKEGRAPTFIFTNQIRYRKGVAGEMTTPGGFTPRHAAAIRLRLSAKDIVDKKVHTSLPARKDVRVVVDKATIPVAAGECIFEIAILKQPGLEVGQVYSNWKIISAASP